LHPIGVRTPRWRSRLATHAANLTLPPDVAPQLAAFFVVPNHSLDVCYWHFSDIPPAQTNVRYRG